jgi:hypothetical protein
MAHSSSSVFRLASHDILPPFITFLGCYRPVCGQMPHDPRIFQQAERSILDLPPPVQPVMLGSHPPLRLLGLVSGKDNPPSHPCPCLRHLFSPSIPRSSGTRYVHPSAWILPPRPLTIEPPVHSPTWCALRLLLALSVPGIRGLELRSSSTYSGVGRIPFRFPFHGHGSTNTNG